MAMMPGGPQIDELTLMAMNRGRVGANPFLTGAPSSSFEGPKPGPAGPSQLMQSALPPNVPGSANRRPQVLPNPAPTMPGPKPGPQGPGLVGRLPPLPNSLRFGNMDLNRGGMSDVMSYSDWVQHRLAGLNPTLQNGVPMVQQDGQDVRLSDVLSYDRFMFGDPGPAWVKPETPKTPETPETPTTPQPKTPTTPRTPRPVGPNDYYIGHNFLGYLGTESGPGSMARSVFGMP